MKVTIITPTFNSAATIERNIISVKKQSYKNIEHLFIDNLSDDGTLDTVKILYNQDESFRIISEQDQGISDAFSRGVHYSNGEIIGILNSDDELIDVDIIAKIVEAFKDEQVDFVHGDMIFIDDNYGTSHRKPLLCDLRYAMPINHPSLYVRKRVYDKIGTFKLDYRFAMDFEWLCRMYSHPNQCNFKSRYIEKSFVNMYAGGASDRHELTSIDEVIRALQEHGFWDLKARYYQMMRKLRIRLKFILTALKLDLIVKLWRRLKWS